MDAPLDHVMMRVSDLETSLDWYQTHLGYEEKGRWEAESFTNVYLGPAEGHEAGAVLELTSNHGSEPEELGDGWGHIAVRVPEDELQQRYDELMAEGVDDYRDPESCGNRYAFIKDPDGHEIEIVKRDFGPLYSLDHTMIRVEDVTRAIGFWSRVFEYELSGRWEADTFANYFLRPSGSPREAMSVELTYNYDGRSYTLGDAWGHLAVQVNDLAGAWDEITTREAAPDRSPEACDNLYAFTEDGESHEIELLEEHVTN